MPRRYPSPEVRFWSRVALPNTAGCLLWLGGTGSQGYGHLIVRGREMPAHRFAYELAYGAVPDGHVIDHLCRVRHCVRPEHLEAVTHVENVKRGEVGRNSREKTTCPAGHLYDQVNTRISREGKRVCRACHRNHAARYYREKNQ